MHCRHTFKVLCMLLIFWVVHRIVSSFIFSVLFNMRIQSFKIWTADLTLYLTHMILTTPISFSDWICCNVIHFWENSLLCITTRRRVQCCPFYALLWMWWIDMHDIRNNSKLFYGNSKYNPWWEYQAKFTSRWMYLFPDRPIRTPTWLSQTNIRVWKCAVLHLLSWAKIWHVRKGLSLRHT